MPTYQYACTQCGHTFEAVQSFSEDSLTVCPECDGKLRKVFNAVGVVFKGSGFYRTDSRSSSTASDTASHHKEHSASTSTSTSSGSSESSPASSASAASTSAS